jgi:CMP-N,N'-diacetyllegionaminic acid synthase
VKVLALIPARGGSKGIPKKNIVAFGGRPLIAHTIQTALASQAFDRIVVTTDDEEIAAVARDSGAEVPFMRPAELAADEIKDLAVFSHALRWLQEHQEYSPELVMALRPTSPLRTLDDIRQTIEKIRTSECDSVRTACVSEYHPYRMVRLDDDVARPLLPDEAPIVPYRRQELPPVYRWNGLADVMWSKTILRGNTMFGQTVRAVITPRERSIDIDDEFDLFLAECALKWKYNQY